MIDLISVIVPVYGVEKDLEKCVHSIQQQTYSNLEIILVDDGSPDRCGEICDELALHDDRIRVIHKKNGGLSDARNVGMDAAQGAYLAFVDSDDWIDPPMLEILHRLCATQHVSIAECSFRNIHSNFVREETLCSGTMLKATPLQAIEGNLRWKWFKTIVWNKLYHRDTIGNIRFPKGKVHEDEFTTHKFYLASQGIAYIDLSFYNYNKKRDVSITGSFRLANLDAIEAFHEKANLCFHNGELASLLPQMCNNYCYVFFDKLAKCIQAGMQGERLDIVSKLFLQDMEWMKDVSLEAHYLRLYNTLLQHGQQACANAWNKLTGG